MRDTRHKPLKALNFNRRDWVVLLLALLLAFSIWLIHNLSLRYNDYLNASVIAVCNIDGHSETSANRCEVMARCRTTGYNVLKYNRKAKHGSKKVAFSPAVMKHDRDDIYYVTSADLQEYAHLIYGDNVTVEYFVSDTLFFRFPYQDSKKVPVSIVSSLSFRPQYMSYGELTCVPDSVVIYGERKKLESISRVYTAPVKHSDLNEDVRGLVDLEKIRGVRMSVSEVHYSLDVTRFVALSGRKRVIPVNVPAGKDMIVFPSYVDVTWNCVFPMNEDKTSDMEIVADYNDFVRSLSGKCVVKPSALPAGVISCQVSPEVVDCVLEEQ